MDGYQPLAMELSDCTFPSRAMVWLGEPKRSLTGACCRVSRYTAMTEICLRTRWDRKEADVLLWESRKERDDRTGYIERGRGGDCKQQNLTRLLHSGTSQVWNTLGRPMAFCWTASFIIRSLSLAIAWSAIDLAMIACLETRTLKYLEHWFNLCNYCQAWRICPTHRSLSFGLALSYRGLVDPSPIR